MSLSSSLPNVFSKLAALALLAAVVAGLSLGVAAPVLERFRDLDTKIAVQRALLGRYGAVLENSSATGTVPGLEQSDQAFLAGETDALRLAGLQATLNGAAAALQVRFSSTRSLDAVEQEGVRLLGLQVQVSTSLATLQSLLFDVEKRRPNMIVDALHITRAPESAANVPPLDVTFSLLGAAPKKKE